jgi:polysaccharide pyruvyl transferase WcaK-like protein
MRKTRILLLTNRDSDNVGDQIIEASVISILKGVMKNLGISEDDYEIRSRAGGIISKKYRQTLDPKLLEPARQEISEADLLIFGGAPVFNYKYQDFYLRTITTVEIAQEFGVPVLFSSVGVEPFDAENSKSMALKKALELPCVKQMTTRDDVESLKKYAAGTDTPVARVADPAVFADIVFRPAPAQGPDVSAEKEETKVEGASGQSLAKKVAKRLLAHVPGDAEAAVRRGRAKVAGVPYVAEPSTGKAGTVASKNPPAAQSSNSGAKTKKRIGLVVTRARIFADNDIQFSEHDQRQFWKDVMALLKSKGYDFTLFTTGHFADEVFLDAFVRSGGAPSSKSQVVTTSPEELIDQIRSCDGLIAYRLHASITSFAFDVPSVGLSWNFKVPYFYETVGHGDRALPPEDWNAQRVVDALETAMREGVRKDQDFLMTVYRTLFAGVKGVVAPRSKAEPYSRAQLDTELPRYGGTNRKQYRAKANRKFRRAYGAYQRNTKK